jgi:RNA polymerase sigma-70 factor (ECF subfamily)
MTQETLTRLVLKVDRGEFDPARGSLIAYAFGLAHYVARESSRAGRREIASSHEAPWEEAPDGALAADQAFAANRQVLALRRAIQTLAGPEQEVIALLVDQDLSLPQIAEILSMPLNTVKSHVHRAKARLREALQAQGQGETYEGQ